MKPRRQHKWIVSGLLTLGLLGAGTPGPGVFAAAARKPEPAWQVVNHYQRTGLYLPLGSYVNLSKEAPLAEGCVRLSTANGNTWYHCPRSFLFLPGRRMSFLKEVRLRPRALQESGADDLSLYPFVRRLLPQDRSIKTSGSTRPIVTLQVVEVQLLSGQYPPRVQGKPKVLKSLQKLSLKLGEDNAVPLDLPLNGGQNVGIVLSVTVDEEAKKAQIIYLEASDQSQLWMRKENPFVYELQPEGFVPAFGHADVRFVYR